MLTYMLRNILLNNNYYYIERCMLRQLLHWIIQWTDTISMLKSNN